ncbi:MAG: DUF3187 family protein [Pseudomonadota bacterium]
MKRLLPLLLALCAGAHADTLPEDDNAPLTGGFGLPGVDEGGLLLAPGKFRLNASFITASHAIVEQRGDESLILDGESARFTVDIRAGVADGIEVGLEIPWVGHTSGNLDSLIDTWHDIFQLPEGSRDNRPQDVLEFSYADERGQLIDFTNSANGIGDIRLYAGFDIDSAETHQRALRVSAKLPTGDADKFLGSGGFDLAVGVAGDLQQIGGNEEVSAFYRASVTYVSEPDLLASRYEDYIGQLSGGIAIDMSRRIQLNAQSTLRTAVYDSDIEKLGEMSWTLTFGGNIRLSPLFVLSLGVSEDIKVNSAPDVSFNIGLRYRPER